MDRKDPVSVGKTKDAQRRNAQLLSGYQYDKYITSLTGFAGQDRQCIRCLRRADAIRSRVGTRGHFKAAMTQLTDGRLFVAVARKKQFDVPLLIYESCDLGLTWQPVSEVLPSYDDDREVSLTTLPDDSLLLTSQNAIGIDGGHIPLCRSSDSGRTWEVNAVDGGDYPRSLVVEADGSLLMVRALDRWREDHKGSPNLRLDRSYDGGRSWEFSEGQVDWDYATCGEIACIRLSDGRLLAAMRNQVPQTAGEGFEDTRITESSDDGRHWSKPRRMGNTGEVHAYLTELDDGRVLATYANYHLPWGIFAVVSEDGGRTWNADNPIELALSADFDVGWPVTLRLPDGGLITCYGSTTYLQADYYDADYMKWRSEKQTCEVVRWHLPY